MQKTTVYLSEELKAAVSREALRLGVAEAEVIRQAIAAAVSRPRPRSGLFSSEAPFAEAADELMTGFGER